MLRREDDAMESRHGRDPNARSETAQAVLAKPCDSYSFLVGSAEAAIASIRGLPEAMPLSGETDHDEAAISNGSHALRVRSAEAAIAFRQGRWSNSSAATAQAVQRRPDGKNSLMQR